MPKILIAAEGQQESVALDAAIVTLGRGLESDVRLKDIKASRAFYEQFGFTSVMGDTENWVILKNGDHVIGLF